MQIKTFPIFLITLGIITLLETTNIYDGAFFKLWPLLLIIVGLIKILNSLLSNINSKKKEKN